MNLFIIAVNFPGENHSRVLAELQRMSDIYPLLDRNTMWHRSSASGFLFTASMHTSDHAASPRRYVLQSDDQVVFYSGLPVHSKGSFPAHHAEALALHWDQVLEDLDGMYCIVRTNHDASQLELITDIVGMEQVFYFRKDGVWLISNSVRLIERICGNLTLDPSGVSLFLSMSYAGDNRTLLSEIKVLPGGQHWTWKEGDKEPGEETYYSPARLTSLERVKPTPSYYRGLADDLIQVMKSFNQGLDNFICALTGGRDTRLVTSLLISAGLSAKHYTFGESTGADAKIARQIAETFHLNYRLVDISASRVIDSWDNISEQIVFQGDGMVIIDIIPSVLSLQTLHNGHLLVDFGGTGGELAKGFFTTPNFNFFHNRYNLNDMQKYMSRIALTYGGVVREEAAEITRRHIYDFVTQHADFGYNLNDIPDAFFLYSRLRRKRGSNKRIYMQYQDFFSPCFTRSFIEAVFSMPAKNRYTEPLHYNLIHLLTPELHGFPLDKGTWRSQKPTDHLIAFYRRLIVNKFQRLQSKLLRSGSELNKPAAKRHTATDMFDQQKWFEAKREQVREFCMDNKQSIIWDFVNRPLFEKITSPSSDVKELAQFMSYVDIFFRTATLMYYEKSLNK